MKAGLELPKMKPDADGDAVLPAKCTVAARRMRAALRWSPDTPPPPLLAAGGAWTSKTVAVNRVARREFEILDEYEAGIALVGTEVRQHAHARSTSRVLLHQPHCDSRDAVSTADRRRRHHRRRRRCRLTT